MDIENLLDGAVRVANFVTTRFLFFSFLVFLTFPLVGIDLNVANGVIDGLPVVEKAILSYKNTIDALGISSVAIYILFFALVTILHVCYSSAVAIGAAIPPSFKYYSLDDLDYLLRNELSQTLEEIGLSDESRTKTITNLEGLLEKMKSDRVERHRKNREIFRVSKFSMLLLGILIIFFDPFSNNEFFAQYSGWIFLAVGSAVILLAFNQVMAARNTHLKYIEKARARIESAIRGELNLKQISQVRRVLQENENNFHAKLDWNLPIIGSFRKCCNGVSRKLNTRQCKQNDELQ